MARKTGVDYWGRCGFQSGEFDTIPEFRDFDRGGGVYEHFRIDGDNYGRRQFHEISAPKLEFKITPPGVGWGWRV